MPLYEFECQDCHKEFEKALTVKEYEKGEFSCPHCQSRRVERLVTSAQVITSKKS